VDDRAWKSFGDIREFIKWQILAPSRRSPHLHDVPKTTVFGRAIPCNSTPALGQKRVFDSSNKLLAEK